MTRKWTQVDRDFIKDQHKHLGVKGLAKHFGVSVGSIGHQMKGLGLTSRFTFSEEDIKLIRSQYGKIPNKELADRIGCNSVTLWSKIKKLGIPLRHSRWTSQEIKLLKKWYGKISYKEISSRLNRTVPSIDKKLRELGLRRFKNKHTAPEKQVAYILNQLSVPFEQHVRLKYGPGRSQRFVPDFLLDDKTIIEVMGDFFHCNPSQFPDGPIYRIQKENLERDSRKRAFYDKQGYRVLYLWESETSDTITLTAKLKEFVFGRLASVTKHKKIG